ncbi:MAG TPA: hypothetical protein VF184_13125 [Phycisphaeraceae bacterium]
MTSDDHSADMQPELEAIKDDLKKLRDDVLRMLQAAMDKGWRSARQTAADQVESSVDKMQSCLKRQPILALAAAFAAGLLAGRLWAGK